MARSVWLVYNWRQRSASSADKEKSRWGFMGYTWKYRVWTQRALCFNEAQNSSLWRRKKWLAKWRPPVGHNVTERSSMFVATWARKTESEGAAATDREHEYHVPNNILPPFLFNSSSYLDTCTYLKLLPTKRALTALDFGSTSLDYQVLNGSATSSGQLGWTWQHKEFSSWGWSLRSK